MAFSTIALSVLIVTTLSAFQTPTDATRGMWTIEGDVLVGSEPVADAMVTSRGPAKGEWVKTDEHGHYVFNGSAPGSYTISASKEGQGTAKDRSVGVIAGAKIHGIDLQLDGRATISGRVFDSDGAPLPAGVVGLYSGTTIDGHWRLAYKGYTEISPSGEFELSDLKEGRYYIQASRPLTADTRFHKYESKGPGHAAVYGTMLTAFFPNADSIDSASPVNVKAGEQRHGVDISLKKVGTFCVTATVADVPGSPPHQTAGLAIYQVVGNFFPTVAGGLVAVGEKVEVCDIPTGAYRIIVGTVIVSIASQDPDAKTYKATGFDRTEFTVEKRDVDLKTLYVQPTVPLHGNIGIEGKSADRPFPEGINIALEQQGRPIYAGESRSARVDDHGEFLFEYAAVDNDLLHVTGLPAGYYVREALQEGRDVFRDTVNPAHGDLHVTIAPDGVVVTGQTVNSDNQPVNDAMVVLVGADDQLFTRQSDQNGKFSFDSGIAPGKYRLISLTGLYEGEERDPVVIGSNLSHAVELDLSPHASVSKSIVTRPVTRPR